MSPRPRVTPVGKPVNHLSGTEVGKYASASVPTRSRPAPDWMAGVVYAFCAVWCGYLATLVIRAVWP